MVSITFDIGGTISFFWNGGKCLIEVKARHKQKYIQNLREVSNTKWKVCMTFYSMCEVVRTIYVDGYSVFKQTKLHLLC